RRTVLALRVVYALAWPRALSERASGSAPAGPRGEGAGPRARPRRGLAGDRLRPRAGDAVQARPRQGRSGARLLGRGRRDGGGRLRPHREGVRSGPRHRLLPDPGDEPGLLLLRGPLPPAHRRLDAVLLRLVRRSSAGLPAGLRGPDRRAGVG